MKRRLFISRHPLLTSAYVLVLVASGAVLIVSLREPQVAQTPGALDQPEVFALELKHASATPNESDPFQAILSMSPGQTAWSGFGDDADDMLEKFRKAIRKEPSYMTKAPFRSQVVLADQSYGFALDSTSEKDGYDRLYFDCNHNGDLTDDEVVSAVPAARGLFGALFNTGPKERTFPRVDLRIPVDGADLDYAFTLAVRTYSSTEYSFAHASFRSATWREGEVRLGDKPYRAMLFDFNANGRFDDVVRLEEDMEIEDGRLFTSDGDRMLLVPPDEPLNHATLVNIFEESHNWKSLSRLVQMDERFIRLDVSPRGEQIKVTRPVIAFGSVTHPDYAFAATLYGETGVLQIKGTKGERCSVPAGKWRLLEYTLKPPAGSTRPASATRPAETRKRHSLLALLMGRRAQATTVTATGTKQTRPILVSQDETTVLPFGPPYHAEVKVSRVKRPTAWLSMSVVGSSGEVCTDMLLRGERPGNPQFTITNAKGEVVHRGQFEFG